MASLLRSAPKPLRHVGSHAVRRMGAVTASLRLRPAFLMIGAQRCGTTSLFRAITAHPQVVHASFHKGVNYFDLNYYRGPDWYRGHFPVAEIARRRTAGSGYGDPVVFEASGYYLYHPFAMERIARDLPDVKLVVMLRDPVERAFSAYKHEYARSFEWEPFEQALKLEDDRLLGEIDRMRADLRYESFPHRHHSYRHRGHYAEQLDRVFAHFPRSQLHVIASETFFADPAAEYQHLLEFLGLRPFEPPDFGRHNARPGALMEAETRSELEQYYQPHNERLADLLGRSPQWVR
jgi:hypothetical protein